jgi:PAS domain S-box-containing protein
MSSNFRILHLEDESADALLVQARLESDGLACQILRVETRDAFESALRNASWDVVFADYQLPAYDGVSALHLAQEICPDIPFIMVSGTLGEEAAIECLTRGATDYVTKQKLARLGPVVRRALREAENKRERKGAEKQIALMSFALNNVREAAFLTDEKARFQYVNEEACRMFSYTRAELLCLTVQDIDPYLPLDLWADHWDELMKRGSLTMEGRHRAKDGREFCVEIHANHIEYDGQSYNLALVRDITERKRAAEAVHKLSHVVEQSPVSVVVTDITGAIEYVNPKFTEVTGYTRDEVMGKNPRILKSGLVAPEVYADLWNTLAAGRDWRGELCNKRKDGSNYWERAVISCMVDGEGKATHYIAVKEDITARKQMENEISASLREKETLLKEVHHRVKNNLQIISSLLELQAGKYKDRAVRDAFGESQRRVRTMALVHEQLYTSKRLAEIDFGWHLEQITRELVSLYGRIGIDLIIDVEHVQLPIDLAIPCGLIVNELVTNALKHAFPEGRKGTLMIALHLRGPEHVVLSIGDDGVGFAAAPDVRQMSSLGMQLVTSLSEQISATLVVDTSHGSGFTLTIPLDQNEG